jgi:hypothetical protein
MNRLVILAVYLLMVFAIVYGMWAARRMALATFNSPAAARQWQVWRDQSSEEADPQGPVQRRPSRSPEPPALILMRDYFGVCLVFAVAISSLLYGALALMIVGAVARPERPPADRNE